MATSQGRNQLSFSGGKNDCNLLYLTTKHVFEIARLTPWLPAFNCTDDPGLVQGPFCSALSAAKWAKGSTSLIGWDAASSWSDCRTRTSTRWSWERRWRTWPKTWWLPVFRLNVFLSAVTADVVRFKLRMTLIWLRCPASDKRCEIFIPFSWRWCLLGDWNEVWSQGVAANRRCFNYEQKLAAKCWVISGLHCEVDYRLQCPTLMRCYTRDAQPFRYRRPHYANFLTDATEVKMFLIFALRLFCSHTH